jgi:hypothetical protein
VVVAEKVYSYDAGKAAEEFYPRPEAFITLHSLGQLVKMVRRGRWLPTNGAEGFTDQPDVQFKPIAAGPSVISSQHSELAERIKRHYNDTVAVDMESAGMYRVAQRYVGLPALAVRGISDLLDDKTAEADVTRQPVAARHAAAFSFALLDAVDPDDLKLRSGAIVPTPTPGDQLGALLAKVPPNVVAELERARADSEMDATALLRRLVRDDTLPSDLVTRLLADQPGWLAHSESSHLWAAVAEFAAAYEAREGAVEAFVRAADIGGPEAPRFMARAALAAAGDDLEEYSYELLERARELARGPHPFVEVVAAAIEASSGEAMASELAVRQAASRVLEATEAHGEGDPLVDMMRGRALAMLERTSDALAVYEAILRNHPANAAAALEVARLLLARWAADQSESPVYDLERAREMALQARDLRRGWRGDNAEAAAMAAQATSFLGDVEAILKITLPPPQGEATEAESASDQVKVQASYAILRNGDPQRALELAESIANPVESDLVRAACFKGMPGADDLAKDAYKRALQASAGSSERIRAYFGLAELGEWPLPGLDDLQQQDREVYDLIVAEAELAHGATEDAVRLYRKWRESPRALEALVALYLRKDRIDDAVEVLRDGAERHRNPELRFRAAHVLISAGRYEDAEVEARRAMDAVPAGSRQHHLLRKLRVQLAAKLDKWSEVEEQARAGLEEHIEIPDMRWALVLARYNLHRPEAAFEEMNREPVLEPRDETEAVLAIQLYRLEAHTPQGVRKVLDIADRFAASEQVSAAAFMAAIEMSSDIEMFSDTELPLSIVGRIRSLQNEFFERFPESSAIVRLQDDDEEALVEKLIGYLKETVAPGAPQYEEIIREVISGSRPYGFLSVFAGRPYAEALIKRAAGFLPVASANADVAVAEHETAAHALDDSVVVETSALHTFGLLTLDAKDLLANFRRVLVPAEVLDDALAARESLSLRSTATMGWDPRSDRPTLIEIEEDRAEAWARAADRLVERIRKCEVAPRSPKDEEPAVPERARPWLGPVEMAKGRNLPLFSDDSVLRAAARAEGIATFGTLSLLTVLLDDGKISEEDYKNALMDLRRNRAADLPVDAEQIMALAAEHDWQVGPATFSFTRPALWRDPPHALALYRECITGVLKRDEAILPDWCAAAAIGFARSAPTQPVAQSVGAVLAYTLLTISLLAGELKTELFGPLLVASRQASQNWGGVDPLPAATEVLRDMLPVDVGKSNASQIFARLVEGLDPADRNIALQAYLRPSRA